MSILIILLTGCFANKSLVDFSPTNSMCLDATIANIHSEGCKAVSVEKTTYGVTKISCHDWKKYNSNSTWITSEFYGIAFGTKIPDDVIPICTDPYLIMTTSERD